MVIERSGAFHVRQSRNQPDDRHMAFFELSIRT
jgi:hypothetical protein